MRVYTHRRNRRRVNPLARIVLLIATLIIYMLYGIAYADMKVNEAFDILWDGGVLDRNEQAMYNYGKEQYAIQFEGTNIEDNLLIVYVSRKGEGDLYERYMVMGDHVEDINRFYDIEWGLYGDPEEVLTEFDTYDNRLNRKVLDLLQSMRSSFDGWTIVDCDDRPAPSVARFVNTTELELDTDAIVKSVDKTQEKLKVGVTVMVVTEDDVYDRYFPTDVTVTLVITAVVGIVAILGLFFLIRSWINNPIDHSQKEPPEKLSQHDRLDENYWKDRY